MDARTGSDRRRTTGQAKDRMHLVLKQSAVECRAIAKRFGFQFFHLGLRVSLKPGIPIQVFLDGGPSELSAFYETSASFSENPILAKAARTLTPFDWREAIADGDEAGRSLLHYCSELGMEHGMAVPLRGYAAAHGVLMLSGNLPLPAGDRLRNELFREAHWTAAHLLERFLLGIRDAWETGSRRALTRRQRDALAMAADGKALSAVAKKLGVHSSTARYLVTRAAEKLGAETREEALVRFAAAGKLNHQLFPQSIKDSNFFFVAAKSSSCT